MPRLNVVVDVGSSETRVLWSVDDGSFAFRCFSSDCSLPTSAQTPDVMGSNSFLVQCAKASFVVGQMAADSPLAEAAREGLKIEPAGPKILAALHIALSDVQLDDPSISLMLLLPYDERSSFEVLEELLKRHFKGFRCNGVHYQPSVERMECLAEGGGLIRYLTQLHPHLHSATLLTAMVGFRDFSLIHSCGSAASFSGKSARMGFLWMIKDMEAQVGQLDRFKAAALLYQLGDSSLHSSEFRTLARTHAADLKSIEMSKIAKAARASRRKYKQFVVELLFGFDLDNYEAVILGGGTGDYLAAHLKTFLGDKLLTPEPLIEEMQRDYNFERSQAVRLADVYAAAITQSPVAVEALA